MPRSDHRMDYGNPPVSGIDDVTEKPRCSEIVRTGLPDVRCNRAAPYNVVVKVGGSTHVLPTCRTHIGKAARAWLDVYGRGATVTVEVGP